MIVDQVACWNCCGERFDKDSDRFKLIPPEIMEIMTNPSPFYIILTELSEDVINKERMSEWFDEFAANLHSTVHWLREQGVCEMCNEKLDAIETYV